jgi:hypothetical protein
MTRAEPRTSSRSSGSGCRTRSHRASALSLSSEGWADQHRDRRNRREQIAFLRAHGAERDTERYQHEGEFAGGGEHRAGAHAVTSVRAGRTEQRGHDARLEQRDDDRGSQDEAEPRRDDAHVDRHADAHEEQRQQQAAKRLDVGFELMAVIRSREHYAGEKRAERHRHAGELHQGGGAQHDQQGGSRHHLAGAGAGQQRKEGIEEIAPGHHHDGDAQHDPANRDKRVAELDDVAVGGGCEERQQRQQGHHRHVLEQQDREGALAIRLLQLAALLQDFQRYGGRRHRKREPTDDGTAPAGEPERIGEARQCRRRQEELGGAEAKYGAAQRQQAREFELEADQEQQQDDAELGHRDYGLGRPYQGETIGADEYAGSEVGDDGGEPQQVRQRYADHRHRQQQYR